MFVFVFAFVFVAAVAPLCGVVPDMYASDHIMICATYICEFVLYVCVPLLFASQLVTNPSPLNWKP